MASDPTNDNEKSPTIKFVIEIESNVLWSWIVVNQVNGPNNSFDQSYPNIVDIFFVE
jgi:hypothetical protein